MKTARLKVWRGTSRENGCYEEFEVEFEDGDSVLDGLVRIRLKAPDLAIRFSCFNANVCKECTIVIDGKVDGDLYATESVNIRATAKVKGNVFAPRVGISEGAFFQGQVDMQPSGAAVQEHSARLRQAAQSAPLEGSAVDRVLSGGN